MCSKAVARFEEERTAELCERHQQKKEAATVLIPPILFYTSAKSVGETAVHRSDSSPTNDVISEIRRVDGIVQRETRFSTEVFLLLALAFGKIYQWFFEPRTLLLTISNVNLRRCCSPWSDEGA